MGLLTRNIKGVDCELMHADDVGKLSADSEGTCCAGCPYHDRQHGMECTHHYRDDEDEYCVYAADALVESGALPKNTPTSEYYWFSPVLYELNKE